MVSDLLVSPKHSILSNLPSLHSSRIFWTDPLWQISWNRLGLFHRICWLPSSIQFQNWYTTLSFLFVKNRKQGVCVNNTNSNFKNITQQIPKGSILGNNFRINVSERESLNTTDCFNANKMIVNVNKFESWLLIKKARQNNEAYINR